MRHYKIMKALLWPVFLLGICAWADEPADRNAVDRVIAMFNQFPQQTNPFTSDADGAAALGHLWKGKRRRYQVPHEPSPPGQPTLTISHEPWGEATINMPMMTVEMANPRIVSRTTRFITSDVALVDGAFIYEDDNGNVQSTPLLFVVKKSGDDWKIASVRVLTSH